jgi:hypothetical protein
VITPLSGIATDFNSIRTEASILSAEYKPLFSCGRADAANTSPYGWSSLPLQATSRKASGPPEHQVGIEPNTIPGVGVGGRSPRHREHYSHADSVSTVLLGAQIVSLR